MEIPSVVGVWIFSGTIQYGKLAAMAHVLQDAMYTGLDHEPLLFCRGRLGNVQQFITYMYMHGHCSAH